MTSIHHHYDQLTAKERRFVDTTFDTRIFIEAEACKINLAGDDRIERVVDALAKAIIESRKSRKT